MDKSVYADRTTSCIAVYYPLRKKVKFEFPLPVFVSLLSYGIYSSMYAPMIYANYGAVGQVNGYTNNVIYLIFILLWMGNVIYWTGWLTRHYTSRKKQSISCYYVSVLCGIFLITCVAHIPGDYCSFTLLHWVRTGTMQANMEKYLEEEILRNSPGEDVVVEAITFQKEFILVAPARSHQMQNTGSISECRITMELRA